MDIVVLVNEFYQVAVVLKIYLQHMFDQVLNYEIVKRPFFLDF